MIPAGARKQTIQASTAKRNTNPPCPSDRSSSTTQVASTSQVPSDTTLHNNQSRRHSNISTGSLTVYRLTPINQATLTEENLQSIENAPVIVATPATTTATSPPASAPFAPRQAPTVARVEPVRTITTTTHPRDPSNRRAAHLSSSRLPSSRHAPNSYSTPLARRRLWPTFKPVVNLASATATQAPTAASQNQSSRIHSRPIPSRTQQGNLNYPLGNNHTTFSIGDRVIILDNYLNLYGITGEVIELHPIQVTLRIRRNNSIEIIRKKKSKVAKIFR